MLWRFTLRKGVTFHDGAAAFTADDAVYSFNRAMMPTSAMKELLTSVKEVRKVDDYTIDMETNGANPLLINNLTDLFMMDSGWTGQMAQRPRKMLQQGKQPLPLKTQTERSALC